MLNKLCSDAWSVVATSFSNTVADSESDDVADIATDVAKSKFSENLLRNILDLQPDQQVELFPRFNACSGATRPSSLPGAAALPLLRQIKQRGWPKIAGLDDPDGRPYQRHQSLGGFTLVLLQGFDFGQGQHSDRCWIATRCFYIGAVAPIEFRVILIRRLVVVDNVVGASGALAAVILGIDWRIALNAKAGMFRHYGYDSPIGPIGIHAYALIGARLKVLFEEQAKKRQQAGGANGGSVKPLNNQKDKVEAQVPQPSRDPQSRDLAGDSVNVGAKVIDRADKVIKQGAPELVRAVEQGLECGCYPF